MNIKKSQIIPLINLKPPSLFGYCVRNEEGQYAMINDENSDCVELKSLDLIQYDWRKDDRFVVLADLLSDELNAGDINFTVSYTPKLNPDAKYYIIGSAYMEGK